MRNVVWMDTVTVNAEDLRLANGVLWSPDDGTTPVSMASREGVRPSPSNDLIVTAQSSPNNTVTVSAGRCLVNGSTSATQGAYSLVNDADIVLGPFVDPNRSQDRVDLVVVRVYDKNYLGGSLAEGAIEIVQGVPASSPVAPDVPQNAIGLATVRIATRPTGGAVIAADNISDTRQFTVASGGIVPVNSALKPVSGHVGQMVYESDTDLLAVWASSANWQHVGGVKYPRGVLAHDYWYTSTNSSYSQAEVVIGTVTGVVDANRIIEFSGQVALQADTANTRGTIRVRDTSISGALLAIANSNLDVANVVYVYPYIRIKDSLSAGTHTFVLTFDQTDGGAGNIRVFGVNTGYGATLTVKDVGGT